MSSLVSIITPSFNCSDFISSTIESVINQTYQNWELIIVDDLSTDSSVEIISRYCQIDSRVKLCRLSENQGAAVARNTAIQKANGEFLAFLDSDDLWHPSKLEKQLEFMSKHIDFSFTSYELIDSKGDKMNKKVDVNNYSSAFDYEDMLRKRATLGCSTVMLRKEAFTDINMPLLRTGQDYGLWLKLLKQGKKAHLLRQVYSSYRILPDSISRNKLAKAKRQWQIYRQLESLSMFKALVCFCHYALRAVFRK